MKRRPLDGKRERDRRYRAANKEQIAERRRQHYATHAEQSRERNRQYYDANREQLQAYARRYRELNHDEVRLRDQNRRSTLRTAVFDHYGWSCSCCGSTKRLSIDHVNGDGHQHRIELFGNKNSSSTGMYRWLVRNGLPDGFQTLCRPCNASKHQGDRCRLNHVTAVPS